MADARKIIARVRSFGANLQVVGDEIEIVNSDKLPVEAGAVIQQNSAAIAAVLREDAGEPEPPPLATIVTLDAKPLTIFGATLFDMADLCVHEAQRHDDQKMKAAAYVLSMLSLDEAATREFLGHLAADHPVEARLTRSMLADAPAAMEQAA